jgi:hypothetical protein
MPRLIVSIVLAVVVGIGLWFLTTSSCSRAENLHQATFSRELGPTADESNRSLESSPEAAARAANKVENSQVGRTGSEEALTPQGQGASQADSVRGPSQVSSGESGSGPAGALAAASGLAGKAEQFADDGDYSEAFLETRTAWELVSKFPADPHCKEFTEELINRMRIYGTKANSSKDVDSKEKLLIVQ